MLFVLLLFLFLSMEWASLFITFKHCESLSLNIKGRLLKDGFHSISFVQRDFLFYEEQLQSSLCVDLGLSFLTSQFSFKLLGYWITRGIPPSFAFRQHGYDITHILFYAPHPEFSLFSPPPSSKSHFPFYPFSPKLTLNSCFYSSTPKLSRSLQYIQHCTSILFGLCRC